MTLAVTPRLPVLPRKTINSCSFAVPGKRGATSYPAAQPSGMLLEEPGTPSSQDTGAGHRTPASGPNTRAGPLPTSCHWRPRPVTAGHARPLRQLSAPLRPRGGGREGRFFQRLWSPGHARPPAGAPGWARPSARRELRVHHPPRERNAPPGPQPRAPHLVAEAAGHQQVRAGRAVAAHGLLAAGAGQRVRHVEQGVGAGGRQALGGPARHGAHGSGRAAAASSCARRGGLPQRPRPGPARPRSVGGPAPAGRGTAAATRWPVSGRTGPGRAGLRWAALGCAGLCGAGLLLTAYPLSAPEPAAVRSHLGRGRPASSATPPSPLAAPPPRRLGRPPRGEEAGGEGAGEARPKPRPRPPPRRKCARSPRPLSSAWPALPARGRPGGRRASSPDKCLTEISGGKIRWSILFLSTCVYRGVRGRHARAWGLWGPHVSRDLLASKITQNGRNYAAYYKNGIKPSETQRSWRTWGGEPRTEFKEAGRGFFPGAPRFPGHLASAVEPAVRKANLNEPQKRQGALHMMYDSNSHLHPAALWENCILPASVLPFQAFG